MLSIFRSILKSKIGAAIALVALILIALAFASGDIAGLRNSSVLGSGNAVATVGGKAIDAVQLSQGANRALERFKQQQPTATMKLLVAQGGIDQILNDLIDRSALSVFGKDHQIAISDRLIDSEIAQIPGFQGVDGKFDQNTFRQALAQQGISEKALREEIADNLTAQQLMVPATSGAVMPAYAATRYASLLNEVRSGSVVALPSPLFAPTAAPSDAQLLAFYKSHINDFVRPERRVVRYATFGAEALKAPPPPTDAEITARYQAGKAIYAAQDKRQITQLIVPTEAAAKAIIAEVSGGKSLDVAAKEKGLSTAQLGFFSKDELAGQISSEVADAVFTTPVGKLAAPQKSALGWHVIRVDEEQKKPARPLTAVRDEIAQQLTDEKRRKAFSDMLANIEDQFSNGAGLADVAKNLGVEVEKTEPLTANGQVYGKPGEMAPASVKPVLVTAFSMDQEEPQVAEVERGKTFVIYDVTEIASSAPAPLTEIKDDVKLAWKIDAGSQAAKAAAIRMQVEIRKGKSMEQAMAGAGKPLPPVQQVSLSRPALSAALRSGKEVPPPVSLMFHMAKGTVKVQSAAGERGWFVVLLKDIQPGTVQSEELVKGAQRELGQQLGQAYGEALVKAARNEVGVTKHERAIRAVRNQLAGIGSTN